MYGRYLDLEAGGYRGKGTSRLYQRSDAAITYGDCKARSDEGCAPPLELEHRLCHGTVTVVIWAKETLAARAADALRPLSRGANGRRPEIAFNHSPRCLP